VVKARADLLKMMDLSQPDDMANKLKTWVQKLAESVEGKAALDKVGLFIDPPSEESEDE
jgi:hypothetical protein